MNSKGDIELRELDINGKTIFFFVEWNEKGFWFPLIKRSENTGKMFVPKWSTEREATKWILS